VALLIYYAFIWQFFASGCFHRCDAYYFVSMQHTNDCDSYVEVEYISVKEFNSDYSTSEVEITDTYSGSSVDTQSLQWVDM
jgi:hypothetical protein